MKVLITTGPAHPLYYPVVALAWAFRSAGHDVLVSAPSNFAGTVHASGLHLAPTDPVEMVEVMAHERSGEPIRLPTNDEEMAVAVGRGFGRLGARTLEEISDLVERWTPDVIVSDAYSYAAAAVAAAVHGVPWVQHAVGPGDLEIGMWMAAELAPELGRAGLSELPAPDLLVDNCAPLLCEHAGPGTAMRYVPFGEPTPVPSWVFEPRTRPRALVTLGSIQPGVGDLSLLGDIVRTLASSGAELVVAVADELSDGLLPLPEQVRAAGWMSLTAVLPGCDVAVHHGGPGTMMASLTHGLPQVIIPGKGKPHVAVERLVSYGAALRVPPENPEPEALLAAFRSVLDDPDHRKKAAEVRDQISGQPAPGEVVAAVEKLAAHHPSG